MKSKKQITSVAILDASGSMSALVEDARGGVKSFIEDCVKKMKKDKDKVEMTVIITMFHSVGNFTVLINSNDPKDLKDPDAILASYGAYGSTALYDAIGETFALIPKEQDGVFVNIFTDGQENASREYSSESIKKLFAKAKKNKWGLTFMASDQAAVENARGLGISRSNTMAFAASSKGHTSASIARGMAANTYYSSVINNNVVTDNLMTEEKEEEKVTKNN